MARQRNRYVLLRLVAGLQSNIIGVYSSLRRARSAVAETCVDEEKTAHAIDPDCEYRVETKGNKTVCSTVKNHTVYSVWKYDILRFTEDETLLTSAARTKDGTDEGEGEAED